MLVQDDVYWVMFNKIVDTHKNVCNSLNTLIDRRNILCFI